MREVNKVVAEGGLCAPDGFRWEQRWHWRKLRTGKRVKVRTLRLVKDE